MRTKLTVSALAVAAGFAALPALAQGTGQSHSSMPGMSAAPPAQSGQQQGGGMCGCCQRMAMNAPQQQGQQAPPR
jgi:hypothetical protein